MIGLTGPYTVTEGEPDVEVCAEITDGIIDRSVTVSLFTQPDTASGDYT